MAPMSSSKPLLQRVQIRGPILEFARDSFPSTFRLTGHRIPPLKICQTKSTSGIYGSTFGSRIQDCRDKATLT